MKETVKSFETRASEIEDQAAQAQRELREELLDQSKTLRDEIYKSQQESGAAVDRAAKELRSDKADRSALAELFTEMALRLSGEDAEE